MLAVRGPGHTWCGGEKLGITKSVATRPTHIVAGRIDGRVGEPRVVFHDRVKLHLPGQREKAPSKEAIGEIAGQRRELIGLDYWRREISQVPAEIIQISPRCAVNVGQEKLLTGARS